MSATSLMPRGSATMASTCNKKLESASRQSSPHVVACDDLTWDGLATVSSFSERHRTQPMITSGARRTTAVLRTGRSRHGHSQWIKAGKPSEGRLFAEHPYGKGESDREDRAGFRDRLPSLSFAVRSQHLLARIRALASH